VNKPTRLSPSKPDATDCQAPQSLVVGGFKRLIKSRQLNDYGTNKTTCLATAHTAKARARVLAAKLTTIASAANGPTVPAKASPLLKLSQHSSSSSALASFRSAASKPSVNQL
jgi:hypothetical protein